MTMSFAGSGFLFVTKAGSVTPGGTDQPLNIFVQALILEIARSNNLFHINEIATISDLEYFSLYRI